MKTVKAFYSISVIIILAAFGSIEVSNNIELIYLSVVSLAMLGTVVYINLTVKD